MNNANQTVLVVDDEVQIRRFLRAGFELNGFTVHEAGDGAEALRMATLQPIDLAIVDLGLPDMDGSAVVERIRSWSSVPIIVLSVRSHEAQKVRLLELGADDYVVKPFGFAELQARMEAVLRRARSRPSGQRVVGKLRVDLDRHSVHIGSTPVTLTRKEFQLLAILAAEPEVAVRRDRLFAEVWHTSWQGTSRTLDAHMTALRSKIGAGAEIQTIRGVGYRIVAGG
jgi:two-component system KDP operon response regulator KdpE